MDRDVRDNINPDWFAASDYITEQLKRGNLEEDSKWVMLPHGRGAGASTFATQKILQFLDYDFVKRKQDDTCGCNPAKILVMRNKLSDILETMGIFEWCIAHRKEKNLYDVSIVKRTLTHEGSKSKIRFCAMDEFLPSIRYGEASVQGRNQILWFEEADEFDGELIDNFIQANIGLNGRSIVLFTYNPPRSPHHWINRKAMVHDGTKIITWHGNYQHMRPEWLGEGFFDVAERVKEETPDTFRFEYLGEIDYR